MVHECQGKLGVNRHTTRCTSPQPWSHNASWCL